jgi:large-conductance mechanosensitive channel
MATLIAAQFIEGERVMNSFGDFLVMNGVLSLGAGIIFGVATMFWIRSVSMDVVLPALDVLILGLVRWVNRPFADRVSRIFFSNTEFRLESVFRESVTWLVTLAIAFAIIHHVFRRIFTVRREEIHDEDKNEREQNAS